MSNEVPLKNLVEENDDLIELNPIEEPSIGMESAQSGKKKVQKCRKTSEV